MRVMGYHILHWWGGGNWRRNCRGGLEARGLAAGDGDGQAEVGSLEVVPGEVAQEFEVELGEVVLEQQGA